MCTAISFRTKNHYFGRNLDLEYSYQETVTVTPKSFPLPFRHLHTLHTHYALIGMAYVKDDYPLYYDATNEKGLSMAGLNFPDNACYHDISSNKYNVTPFEFIPWILGKCASVFEAITLIKNTNLIDTPYSNELPLTPLHWIISDAAQSVTVEPLKGGLVIHQNPVGVLTNNPPFPFQIFQLNQYMSLSASPVTDTFSETLSLEAYSRGMGALGLPGDFSSTSRFVKACFLKENSVCGTSESESISQFFHILDSVSHPRGSVRLGKNKYQITVYSSCCNTQKGIYYYTTYENRRITGIDMYAENINGNKLISYPLLTGQDIRIIPSKSS